MKKFIIIFSSIIAFGILANSIDTNNNTTQTQQNIAPQVINQNITSPVKAQIDTNTKLSDTTVKQKEAKQKTTEAQPLEQIHYYENTAGNTVQSPTLYDSRPEGASARCGDGTYSFSQSRRGTCSHHGGVEVWY